MTEKDIVNVLYRDGYHAAAKLIEKKSETIESRKSLILWKGRYSHAGAEMQCCSSISI